LPWHLLAPLSSSTELHTDEICIQVRSTQVVVFFNFVQENRDASAVQFCAPLLRAEKFRGNNLPTTSTTL